MSYLIAIFLYTGEDKKLAHYIGRHIYELQQMAGNKCRLFSIEHVTKQWNFDIRRSFGGSTEEYLNALWKKLGVSNSKPFKKAEAYHVGEHLGITPKQFPSIVFFLGLRAQELLIIEINDFVDTSSENIDEEYTRFFRILFSTSRQAATNRKGEWPSGFQKQLRREWKAATGQESKPIVSVEIATALIEAIGNIVAAFLKN
jgi:hypothetical protein